MWHDLWNWPCPVSQNHLAGQPEMCPGKINNQMGQTRQLNTICNWFCMCVFVPVGVHIFQNSEGGWIKPFICQFDQLKPIADYITQMTETQQLKSATKRPHTYRGIYAFTKKL